MNKAFNVAKFDIGKFDSILARGLSNGIGERGSQVCIEAAICETLNLPHGDDPNCVAESVRRFKIRLNDAQWSSPKARAGGLRDLGLAQLGSLGVVDDIDFAKRLADKTIRVLIPKLYRELWPKDEEVEAVALRCEQEGTRGSALAAKKVANERYAGAYAAYAAAAASSAAAQAADAAAYAASSAADHAASYAAYAAAAASQPKDDTYLILSARLALETLRELNSPGCKLLEAV